MIYTQEKISLCTLKVKKMCITPNIIYINKLIRDEKHPDGIFFTQYSKAELETYEEMKSTLGGEIYKIPCGKCIECKKDISKQWGLRAYAEYQTNPNAYFLTITYENAPKSLLRNDLTLLIKRIRKKYGNNIKFLGCGEYGSKTYRSHFHLLTFGFKINDLIESKYNMEMNDHKLLESEEINKLWKKGLIFIEKITSHSCFYVSGYVDKKLNDDLYKKLNLAKPFKTYSKGLGLEYLKQNYKKIYLDDKIKLPGLKPMKPPHYFDEQLEKIDLKLFNKIKEKRKLSGEYMEMNGKSDYQIFNIYNKNKIYNYNYINQFKQRNKI